MPDVALKYATLQFISKYICTDEVNGRNENNEIIVLSEDRFEALADRFVAELGLGNLTEVCDHPAFKNPDFYSHFKSILGIKAPNFIKQVEEKINT